MKTKRGNLITLAKNGDFDVITHGCNCFCTMGAGIAPQMAKAFGCDKFRLESPEYRGDINKLGMIDYEKVYIPTKKEEPNFITFDSFDLFVINSYTQFYYGKNHLDGVDTPVDYDAITMCMRKINYKFKGKKIGLPMIGAGLAGGDWNKISKIIEKELSDMDVWIIEYDNS